ncbi:MAG: transposase [Nitrospiraceae bacterium]|nr:transposase [Nitrospira sp.]MCA9456221.1 transposase [Nitrospira sp.]MCB9774446.1 transposase [Nitrospiraceae bacterium]
MEKVSRRSKRQQGGRAPFDAVLIFKILVLQTLYNLSDDQTKYQIRDRLSFMRTWITVSPIPSPSVVLRNPRPSPGCGDSLYAI